METTGFFLECHVRVFCWVPQLGGGKVSIDGSMVVVGTHNCERKKTARALRGFDLGEADLFIFSS